MSSFLKDNVSHFKELIGAAFTVDLNIKNEPLWIQGDSNYLKRVFQNLFGNSRDAMSAKGAIAIECWAERPERRSEISSSGFAIPAAAFRRI